MKLDYDTQTRLRSLASTLTSYHIVINSATADIEEARGKLAAARRDAEQVENDIAALLGGVARPAIVMVDGSPWELCDEPPGVTVAAGDGPRIHRLDPPVRFRPYRGHFVT